MNQMKIYSNKYQNDNLIKQSTQLGINDAMYMGSKGINKNKYKSKILSRQKQNIIQMNINEQHPPKYMSKNRLNKISRQKIPKIKNSQQKIVLEQNSPQINEQSNQMIQNNNKKEKIFRYTQKIHKTERVSTKLQKILAKTNFNHTKDIQIKKKMQKYRYYISQIQQYMCKVQQQKKNIHIDHLLLTIYLYKSYRYVIRPQSPHLMVNITLNSQYIAQNNMKVRSKKSQSRHRSYLSLNNTIEESNFVKLKKNIILFDLDQTLVHTFTQFDHKFYDQRDNLLLKLEKFEIIIKNNLKSQDKTKICQDPDIIEGFQQKVKRINNNHLLKIKNNLKFTRKIVGYIRPFAKQVVKRLSQNFILGIFTAAQQIYTNQILKILDPQQKLFDIKLYRQHCLNLSSYLLDRAYGTEYVKDLRILSYQNRQIQLSNVILVDNSPLSYLFQPDNGIPIIPFINNPYDDQLLRVEKFILSHFRNDKDVKNLISDWFGTKFYENYKSIREIVDEIFNKGGKNSNNK